MKMGVSGNNYDAIVNYLYANIAEIGSAIAQKKLRRGEATRKWIAKGMALEGGSLDMGGCEQITDAGLAHLTGIHTLDMTVCKQITDAGLAHLTGIHTLLMYGCDRATVTAARALGFSVEY
jgi:hypothetical protein